jgi:STE24 endopeptidase
MAFRRADGVVKRRRVSLPAAIVGALVVAELAVWLLRPGGVIEPAAVSESSYFSAAELERARDFRSGQRLLALGAIGVQGALLVFLVARPPRRAVRAAERAGRERPLLAGALLGAGLSVSLRLVSLPLSAIARERGVDVGLVTQDWSGWAVDVGKGAAIGALLAGAGAALFLALMRRFPRRWWVGGAAATVAIAVLFTWVAPVVLDPVFNRFDKLPEGRTRTDVVELARRSGVDVGEVYVVDASRRSRAVNAYVTGLGGTKRVVLYDTLIERFSPAQLRLVVAHELAHVKNRDVPRGILWVAIVAPGAMLLTKLLTDRFAARAGAAPGTPAVLPAFALALALVATCVGIVSNQLSRRVEARADAYSLELTREPRAFTSMERRLAIENVVDPDPPAVLVRLFATHPPTIERIGTAVAFERRERLEAIRPPETTGG